MTFRTILAAMLFAFGGLSAASAAALSAADKATVSRIETYLNHIKSVRADFIQGMGKVNANFVIILSVDKVLSVEELAMVSQVGDLAEASSRSAPISSRWRRAAASRKAGSICAAPTSCGSTTRRRRRYRSTREAIF